MLLWEGIESYKENKLIDENRVFCHNDLLGDGIYERYICGRIKAKRFR